MKKVLLALITLSFSVSGYAKDDCSIEAKKEVVTYAKSKFKNQARNLKATSIVDEYLDGDTGDSYEAEDGTRRQEYVSPMYEIFKVEDRKTKTVKDVVQVRYSLITDSETGDFLRCEMEEAQALDESDWSYYLD